MIAMLAGYDIMQLDNSMCNRNGRKALLEAYKGTEIFGFEFPYEPPAWRGDGNYENPEMPCEGLEWAKERGIIAREYTLMLPNGVNSFYHLPMLIMRKKRAMARLIITRCFKATISMHVVVYALLLLLLPEIMMKNRSGCCVRELMC